MNNQDWRHGGGNAYGHPQPQYQQPYDVHQPPQPYDVHQPPQPYDLHQPPHHLHHYPAETPGLVDYKPVVAHPGIHPQGLPGSQTAAQGDPAAPGVQYPNGYGPVLPVPEQQAKGRPPGSLMNTPAAATLDTSEVLDAEDGDDMDEDHGTGHAGEEGTPTGPWPNGNPAPIPIVCNNIKGQFNPVTNMINCLCPLCTHAAENSGQRLDLSPNDFERHCGMAASKKWKTTVRVNMEGRPTLGSYLEQTGFLRPERAGEGSLPPVPTPAPQSVPTSNSPASMAGTSPPRMTGRGRARGRGRLRGRARTRGRGRWGARWPARSHDEQQQALSAFVGIDLQDMTEEQRRDYEVALAAAGKDWLGAKNPKLPVDRVSREGPQFQAEVPEEPLQARPFGREADDPRACLEILTAAEALASVKGQECLAAKALPMDATHDLELLPPPKPEVPLERHERRRKKPQWLANTVDPQHIKEVAKVRPPSPSPSDQDQEPSMARDSDTRDRSPPSRQFYAPPRGYFPPGAPVYYEEPPVPSLARGRRSMPPKRGRLEGRGRQYFGAGPEAPRSRPVGRPRTRDVYDPYHDARNQYPGVRSPHADARAREYVMEEEEEPVITRWEILADGSFHGILRFQGKMYDLVGQPYRRTGSGRWRPEADGYPYHMRDMYSEDYEAEPHVRQSRDISSVLVGEQQWMPERDLSEVQSFRQEEARGRGRGRGRAAPPPEPKQALGESQMDRRAAARQAYERMAAQGPPLDAKCCACDRGAEAGFPSIPGRCEAIKAAHVPLKSDVLGPLLVMNYSAISNKWIHEQCALWTPEVVENGLEHLKEAVRRGRMLKCQHCKEKGATMGCHVASCRYSYHLPCAREGGCALKGGVLTCPTHRPLLQRGPTHEAGMGRRHPLDAGGRRDLDDDDGWHLHGSRPASAAGPPRPGPGRGGYMAPDVYHRSGREHVTREAYSEEEETADESESAWPEEARPAAFARAPPTAGGRGEGGRGRGSRQGAAQPEPVCNLKLEDFKRPDGSVDQQMLAVLDPDRGLDSEKVHDKFGGTMGISGTRPGCCSICCVYRRGKCGTISAPQQCARRVGSALMRRNGLLPSSRKSQPRSVPPPRAAAVPEGGGAGGPAQKAGPSAALSGQRSLRAGPGEAQAGREEPYVLEPEDGEGQGERYDDASAAPQVSERPRLPGPGRGTKLGHVAHRYRDHAELQTLKLASKGQPPGSDGECDSPAPKSYGPRSERGF